MEKPLKSVYESIQTWPQLNNLTHHGVKVDDSTNQTAKNDAFSAEDSFKLYFCSHQKKGRGRGDHIWQNARPETQLFTSWSYDLALPAQPIASPLFGLAAYEALNSIWPRTRFSLKAPNDIYIKNKKCGGILVESLVQGAQFRIIVGLGLNMLAHPQDIKQATHITEHATEFLTEKDLHGLLSQLYTQFAKTILLIQQSELELADRVLLKRVLNKCPYYTESIEDISPAGDIIFNDKVIHWASL